MITMADLLADLEHIRDQIDEAETRLEELKTERDDKVAEARLARIRYADISEATGMSISWINASLVRSDGWRPRAGRPRRLPAAS